MNILFMHPKPARISFKHMKALNECGENVFLICGTLSSDVLPDEMKNVCKEYKPILPLKKVPFYYKTYRSVIRKYVDKWNIDIIQSYSQPDDVAVATIESKPKVPVVFCNRDNTTAYTKELLVSRVIPKNFAYGSFGYVPKHILYHYLYYLEKKAHEQSDGRIFISPGMYDYSNSLYNLNKRNLLFTEWVADDEVVTNPLPKLSDSDGNIHIGFSGAIVVNDDYRNHLPLLQMLAQDNIHVHMHIVCHDKESLERSRIVAKMNDNIHLHDKLLPPDEFIRQLSSYDWGIIPFHAQKTYTDTLLTNKIYDYISAGIPTISSDVKTLSKFLKDEKLGFSYTDLKDLRNKLSKEKPSKYKVKADKYLLSRNMDKMINFYEMVKR